MALIYEEIERGIAEWESFILRRLGSSAQLVSISRFSGNRRVYRAGQRIFKIRRIGNETEKRSNDLAGEYAILKGLQGVSGICRMPEYHNEAEWEILSYDAIPGQSLDDLLREGGLPEFRLFFKVLAIIIRINLHGIAHRDIKPENIIVGEDGEVYLIDFDQAIKTVALSALCIDLFAWGSNGLHCFRGLVADYYRLRWMRWLNPISIARKLHRLTRRAMSSSQKSPSTPQCHSDDPDLQALRQAWEIAVRAGANAPGENVAYYDLEVAACHFRGERSWVERWAEISKRVDFAGKRIVECGCNLGLFSAFARRAGAAQCVGVDRSRQILAGARLVSKALHADTAFMPIDFDSAERWEEQLTGFDMVIALSVVNWLTNRERFFAFLGRHREVVYEGHDSVATETNRLKQAGFKEFRVLFVSERKRAILYARK